MLLIEAVLKGFCWDKFLDEAYGKKIQARVEEGANVSRPTARKLIAGRATPKTKERAAKEVLDNVRKRLCEAGLSDEQVDGWIDGHPSIKEPWRVFQGMMYEFLDVEYYPEAYAFAGTIDEMMIEIPGRYRSGGFQGVINFLWSNKNFSSDYHVSHDPNGVSFQYFCSKEEEEFIWQINAFMRNIQISLFSLLDLEFFSRWFHRYQPEPFLVKLSPAKSERLRSGHVYKRGDFIFPYRRLIDLAAILAVKLNTRQWGQVPTVDEIAAMANEDLALITKIRAGERVFTFGHFSRLWSEMTIKAKKMHSKDIPVPDVLYFTACYFQSAFCSIKPLKTIDTIDEEYRYWWGIHLQYWRKEGRCPRGHLAMPKCLQDI